MERKCYHHKTCPNQYKRFFTKPFHDSFSKDHNETEAERLQDRGRQTEMGIVRHTQKQSKCHTVTETKNYTARGRKRLAHAWRQRESDKQRKLA